MKLHTTAKVVGIKNRIIAKITRDSIIHRREDFFWLVDHVSSDIDCKGYAGVLTRQVPEPEKIGTPWIGGFNSMELLEPGYIISVERNGFTHVLYRPDSRNNTIFATGQCNNNCLMCSQPPKSAEDSSWIESRLRLIDLINDDPETLCITV